MNVWFARCNGELSVHNDRSRPNDWVPGEPGGPPHGFNYREKCLQEGFARIGWPNTGDVLNGFCYRLVPKSYSFETIAPEHQRYVREFATIQVGDLMLIPAYTRRYEVHLGRVIRRTRRTREEVPARVGEPAYYYFHDIPGGDWYECAHRVHVRWHFGPDGTAVVHAIPEIGGSWLRGFSRLKEARPRVVEIAAQVGLR